jgi:hypothetical protein
MTPKEIHDKNKGLLERLASGPLRNEQEKTIWGAYNERDIDEVRAMNPRNVFSSSPLGPNISDDAKKPRPVRTLEEQVSLNNLYSCGNTKPPKEIGIKHDTGKLRYGLLPPQPLRQIVKVFSFGAKKYGDYNWSHVDNGISRYTDALLRHIEAWRSGEKYDPETGFHHLAHAGANILFLLFFDEKPETITP